MEYWYSPEYQLFSGILDEEDKINERSKLVQQGKLSKDDFKHWLETVDG